VAGNSKFTAVKLQLLILLAALVSGLTSKAQRYVRSTAVDVYLEAETKDGVLLKGHSKEVQIEYPPGAGLMIVRLDPKTIKTDNLTFDQHMEAAFLGAIVFELPFQTSEIEYRSLQNETLITEAQASINNIEKPITIHLNITNNKSNLKNIYSISGLTLISVEAFELNRHFPELGGSIKLEFAQTAEINY
jgi:hypothetical protein